MAYGGKFFKIGFNMATMHKIKEIYKRYSISQYNSCLENGDSLQNCAYIEANKTKVSFDMFVSR